MRREFSVLSVLSLSRCVYCRSHCDAVCVLSNSNDICMVKLVRYLLVDFRFFVVAVHTSRIKAKISSFSWNEIPMFSHPVCEERWILFFFSWQNVLNPFWLKSCRRHRQKCHVQIDESLWSTVIMIDQELNRFNPTRTIVLR